jgi:hypothetical protein
MTTAPGRRWWRRHGIVGLGLVALSAAAVSTAAAGPAAPTPSAATARSAAPSTLADHADADGANAAPATDSEPRQPASSPRRFKIGIELDANFRHSEDTRFGYSPLYGALQQTVDPGSHAEVSNVSLLADYDPSPLWHAHLRFNGVNLYYRNPTSTDHRYDLAELWVRWGREAATAAVPERPGFYVKLGKFARPERQQDRHLQSYGLVGTAFDLFEDAGLEAGADFGRHVFAKLAVSQGNPLFVRDPNALAGDTPDLLLRYGSARLDGGFTILYDTRVERLDFAHPEAAAYLGWRFADEAGANRLQLMAFGRRRTLAATVDLPGSPLDGDLATLRPLGAPILPLRGNGKQEVGAVLWFYHGGLAVFAEYVDQLVAGLGRAGIEAEAAWQIELPLAFAASGRQLFPYLEPAVRYSKLHNRFYNLQPTPEPSLAWDWEKLDGGVRLGIWGGIDLTVEYAYNRIFLTSGRTIHENELLGTLRIRL